ncbi:MAG: FAD-dependent oxidoreductase [Rhodoferax sp.]
MKIAIVGSGISGLAVAHALRGRAQLSLFEAGDYFGGHTHTVDVTLPTPEGVRTHGVDTGFLVFNERTYPQLIALLAELEVPTARTDMSFSVQVPASAHAPALEWNGANLDTVFAQRSNLLRPRFWGMLAEVLRFNRLATALAERKNDAELMQPLVEFLTQHRFGEGFRDGYLLPMLGCIWSCPTDQMLHFPVATLVRFCHNHGLIQVNHRPQWWTVAGGARQYVEKIVATVPDRRLSTPVVAIRREASGVRLTSTHQDRTHVEHFDRVVLACHSDQALALLRDASPAERRVLGAIGYRPNRAVLHTDALHLPKRPRAWAAWNYERAASADAESAQVCLHYWLNRLQPLPFTQPVLVSLNPIRPIDPDRVLGEFSYAHPVFDLAAIRAQAQMPELQGQNHTYFCGAWMGYGFHEDGLKAGLDVARRIQALV